MPKATKSTLAPCQDCGGDGRITRHVWDPALAVREPVEETCRRCAGVGNIDLGPLALAPSDQA